eukprot:3360137-Pyramimonas_sp.AAC.1
MIVSIRALPPSPLRGGLVETAIVGLRGPPSSPRLDAAREAGASGPKEGSGGRFSMAAASSRPPPTL